MAFKIIPDFPNYLLTPEGNVYSQKRGRWLKPVEYRPNRDDLSYYMYCLSHPGRQSKNVSVRTLILKTYGPQTASQYNPITPPPQTESLSFPTLEELEDINEQQTNKKQPLTHTQLVLKPIPNSPGYFLTPEGNVYSQKRGRWLKPVPNISPKVIMPRKMPAYKYTIPYLDRNRNVLVKRLIEEVYGPDFTDNTYDNRKPPQTLDIPTQEEVDLALLNGQEPEYALDSTYNRINIQDILRESNNSNNIEEDEQDEGEYIGGEDDSWDEDDNEEE